MSEWTSGMAWSDIAKSAFLAYQASREVSLPRWDDLQPETRIAWEACARQVGECLGLLGDTLPPDEQHWKGWKPPQVKEIKE